jgi:hypothetical protein
MKKQNINFEKQLNEAAKIAKVFVANQSTVQMMISKGEKIEKKFIYYEDYVDDLFKKKKELAVQLVKPIPMMREDLGSAILSSIYEEMRDSLALGMFPSAIMHSILLLEYAMRIRLYEERKKSDQNAKWKDVAGLLIRPLTAALLKAKVINKDQSIELNGFNDKIRNPYMHINIYELTKGLTIDVTGVNIIKEEVNRIKEFSVTENPHMWFAGKKKYDAKYVLGIMSYCVNYVNVIF